jgi:hypothetical protein
MIIRLIALPTVLFIAAVTTGGGRCDIEVRTNVPGATVTLHPWFYGVEPEAGALERQANKKGVAQFRLPDHPEALAKVQVSVRAAGHIGHSGWIGEDLPDDRVIEVTLIPGRLVEGIVRDETGQAVAGALVCKGTGSETTDSEGHFRIHVRESASMLQIEHPDLVPTQVPIPKDGSDVEAVLRRGIDLRGRTIFPDGRPVPRVPVLAWAQSKAQRPLDLRHSESDGTFVVRGLSAGWYELYSHGFAAPVAVFVSADTREVTLKADGHTVLISFQDLRGRPFRLARFHGTCIKDGERVHRFERFRSTGDGVFCAHGIPEGTLSLSPRIPGYRQNAVNFEISGRRRVHNMTVVMHRQDPTGSLALHVTETDGETRPEEAYLTLKDAAGVPILDLDRLRLAIDARGSATVHGVPPGRYSALIEPYPEGTPRLDDYRIPDARELVVKPVAPTPLRSVFRLGGRIRLIVLDKYGNTIPVPQFNLRDESGRRVSAGFAPQERVDTYGKKMLSSVSLLPLPPGRYTAEPARAGTHGPQKVVVPEARTVSLVFKAK